MNPSGDALRRGMPKKFYAITTTNIDGLLDELDLSHDPDARECADGEISVLATCSRADDADGEAREMISRTNMDVTALRIEVVSTRRGKL